jgi:hypothetical protein
MVVQSVKIVVLGCMVMGVSCAKRGSIVFLLWTILRPVFHALLEDINQTLGKQTAYRVHQENINTLKAT